MKKMLMLMAFAAISVVALAIPAKRGVQKTLTLTDGKTVTATLAGDEAFHYYVTTDGTPLVETADGRWQAVSKELVKQTSKELGERRNAHRLDRLAKTNKMFTSARKAARRAETAVVKKKGLVILVNFADKSFKSTSKHEYFVQMMNDENNPYGQNYGSVHEYFRDQSYGQFDLEFDVVGPVTVSNNMNYYGANDSNGDDKHPHVMVSEACKLADSQVNFADYDWDGDGEVDQVYVVYAGYAESSGGASNTIWPHEYNLSGGYYWDSAFSEYYKKDNNIYSLVLDGVTIDTYACGSELYGASGSKIDGIGTMCHEFSHCLGLPDFYDTEYSGNLGMDSWDLMDAGAYNGDGFQPAGYTAYERWFSGWLEPVQLTNPLTVKDMPAIQDSPVAYVLMKSGKADANSTYYLMYNHQQKGWDGASYGHGMLVQYVRYNAQDWEENTVNNSTQRMTIIPADGAFKYDAGSQDSPYYSAAGLAGDPWPGTSKKTAFSWNNHTFSEITEKDGLIFFLFDGGNSIAAPVINKDAGSHTATSFTAVWSTVTEAESYTFRYREKAEEAFTTLLSENFENFIRASDGTKDVSDQIDVLTQTTGWTSYKLYQGVSGAKLGTGSASGYLTSPTLQSATGTVSVRFNALSYGSDNSSLVINILSGSEIVATQTVNTLDGNDKIVSFTGVPETFSVQFANKAAKKRFYLSNICIYDGEVSMEDITESEVKRFAPAAWTTVENIQATRYTVTSLTPNTTYEYQVQAVDADGNTSSWSPIASVTLSDAVAISDVNASGNQSAANSHIFDLSGRRIANGQRAAASGQLPKGLYIINGKKVVR
ncbi:MAG: M6 family metalloprotease domain-containing protein [Bacteroidaceae bacterium]|nr:M6 family metalloprotease domain-containing protein [Bacteroidaceae bacterium]